MPATQNPTSLVFFIPQNAAFPRHYPFSLLSTLLILTTARKKAPTPTTAQPSNQLRPTESTPPSPTSPPTSRSRTTATRPTAPRTAPASPPAVTRNTTQIFNSRRAAHIPFTFSVSQDAGNTNSQDLVVAFAGLPCSGPGPGPFSFEFKLPPPVRLLLKRPAGPDRHVSRRRHAGLGETRRRGIRSSPLTGSLVGSFELPTASAVEIFTKFILTYLLTVSK